jgi:hypothetical protein
VKRAAAEWLICLLAIAAGLGVAELWKALLRRLPEEGGRLGAGLEAGGPDDA